MRRIIRYHTAEILEPRAHLPAQNSSKLFPLLLLTGLILPVVSGAFFAIAYIGFPNGPTPVAPYLLLPLGLLSAAMGQRFSAGRWEGGVAEVLHIRLTYAALAYLGFAVKYALAGRSIQRHPAGLFVVISGILLVLRLLIKYRANFFAVVRKGR